MRDDFLRANLAEKILAHAEIEICRYELVQLPARPQTAAPPAITTLALAFVLMFLLMHKLLPSKMSAGQTVAPSTGANTNRHINTPSRKTVVPPTRTTQRAI